MVLRAPAVPEHAHGEQQGAGEEQREAVFRVSGAVAVGLFEAEVDDVDEACAGVCADDVAQC